MVVSTHLKNMLVKFDHFPKVRDENNKYLSCHQPVNGCDLFINGIYLGYVGFTEGSSLQGRLTCHNQAK